MIVRFIGENKDRYGVEPMCAQLAGLGCAFAPSTYYDARRRPRSRRAIADEYLMELIQKTYDENYSCYGARKIWLALRQDDHDVARCTVERLMRVLGLRGRPGARSSARRSLTRPRPGRKTWSGATSPRRPEPAVGRGLYVHIHAGRLGVCRFRH